MKRYKVVGIKNFHDKDDFKYVLRLMEMGGYIFHYPVDHIVDRTNWETAVVYSSPTDSHKLYVTDTDDIPYELEGEIDLSKYF